MTNQAMEIKMTEQQTNPSRVTILGINGHIGHATARAFVAAGWQVTGFGRSNRHHVAGVRFVQGDAGSVAEMAAAIEGADVVVHALNLRYDQWDRGRYEALTARVISAMAAAPGKTMLFPANIYNYAASLRHVTPEAPQVPAAARGAIRVRIEGMLREAAYGGYFRIVFLRAGDLLGPGTSG
jgi:nucleoside-diphosphate-sugar epimerase